MPHMTLEERSDEVYLAGERVLPGIYRQIEGIREIRLDTEDVLPASLDGRVACYMRVNSTWAEVSRKEVGVRC